MGTPHTPGNWNPVRNPEIWPYPQAHFAQLMSDSDEFEYESDDDPYGGAEEEAMLAVYSVGICWHRLL
eukprot:s856_g17.t1